LGPAPTLSGGFAALISFLSMRGPKGRIPSTGLAPTRQRGIPLSSCLLLSVQQLRFLLGKKPLHPAPKIERVQKYPFSFEKRVWEYPSRNEELGIRKHNLSLLYHIIIPNDARRGAASACGKYSLGSPLKKTEKEMQTEGLPFSGEVMTQHLKE